MQLFELPTDFELVRQFGLERTGERRAPVKGELFLSRRGEVLEATGDMPSDDYEILGLCRPPRTAPLRRA